MTERAFEKKCVEKLRKLPRSFWPDKAALETVPGSPDRIGCVNGKYVAIEFKKSMRDALAKTKTTERQRYYIDKINWSGGFGVFCYPENWETVYKQLKELSNV